MKGLKFIGRGSAFNTKEGNNSAYIKRNGKLLLIDCGETVFARIKELNLLEDVTDVYVLLTHLHSDHSGSLGSLIAYCYYVLKIKINVIYPNMDKITDFLALSELDNNAFTVLKPYRCDAERILRDHKLNVRIMYFHTVHTAIDNAYGYIIVDDEEKMVYYYSGDSNRYLFNDMKIVSDDDDIKDYIVYQDTCLADYDGNVHLSLNKLCEAVPCREVRKKIYCMHLDSDELMIKAKQAGFNVVKTESTYFEDEKVKWQSIEVDYIQACENLFNEMKDLENLTDVEKVFIEQGKKVEEICGKYRLINKDTGKEVCKNEEDTENI